MRPAFLTVIVLAAACSDGQVAPPAPANGPAPPAAAAGVPAAPPVPFEASCDDAELGRLVTAAAADGRFDALAALTLPPRCDRVRVAVHVLHDALLSTAGAPPRAALLSAFEALAKANGGASANALGPLVAAWRGWTDEQFAAETALARRYAAALSAMQRPKLNGPALASCIAGSESPPPKSPAAAQLAFMRAVVLLASTPGDASVPQEIADAYDHATSLFAELGWPGGLGSLAELLATRLVAENPKSFRAQHLADLAQAAFARSGDEVRASLVFLVTAKAAAARGDLRSAERLSDGARQRLMAMPGAPARGRELIDVLLTHGRFAQMLGRQSDAARDLGKAWEEARWAQMDVGQRVEIAARLATTLVLIGRYADAYSVTREAATIHDEAVARGRDAMMPVRATLDEIAAQAALDLARAAEAVELYRTAAALHEKEPGGEGLVPRRTDLLLAAQAVLRAGDAEASVKAVDAVLAEKDLTAPTRAHASSVLREAMRLDEADRELTMAEKEGGKEFASALTEERARLRAARQDFAGARELFQRAVDRASTSDPDRPAGWDAARVLLDWARMEMGLGRTFEASELAGRACVELSGSGLEMELDKARKLYVDLQRARGMFIDADKATVQRLAAGPPGGAARAEDARLDQLLIRVELAFEQQKDAEKNALAAVEALPEGWRRDLAAQAVRATKGEATTSPVAAASEAGPRWRLLRDVVAADGDAAQLVARCGAAEPELRRWAALRVIRPTQTFRAGPMPAPRTGEPPRALPPADPVGGIELRRRADVADAAREPLGLADDEALLLVEPAGATTYIVLERNGAPVFCVESPGDAGLRDLWDATWVEPTKEHLDAAARRVSDAIFGEGVASRLAGVKRLFVSLPEPLGPLPFDLLPYGGATLLDAFEVVTVTSRTELVRAHGRTKPPLLAELTSPYASLDGRHALVRVGNAEGKVRARLFDLVGRSENAGLAASAALREAKLALRAEWKPDPKAPPAVPAWAAFLLRGSP